MSRIVVLGAGSWGTALAQILSYNGHDVILWGRNQAQMAEMSKLKVNKKYLPQVTLSSTLICTSEWPSLDHCDYVLVSVPAQKQRLLLEEHLDDLKNSTAIFIDVAKGIETSTQKCLHEIYEELLGNIKERYVVLSGPSHAEEFGLNMPTALVATAYNHSHAIKVQELFMNDNVRVYTSEDVIGVELAGALKNVIALAIGMTIGLGYGDNAQAALMTRGLAEITRLGVALGAEPYTFLGLTGVGDLIVTCTSMHSRNRRAGMMIGEGKTLNEVLDCMGMVVEGAMTTKAAYQLAKKHEIEMPILEQMYKVLYEEADVNEAARTLLTRTQRSEYESYLMCN